MKMVDMRWGKGEKEKEGLAHEGDIGNRSFWLLIPWWGEKGERGREKEDCRVRSCALLSPREAPGTWGKKKKEREKRKRKGEKCAWRKTSGTRETFGLNAGRGKWGKERKGDRGNVPVCKACQRRN